MIERAHPSEQILHPPSGPRRILVLGCPGAGKSTFARILASRSGLPLFHMDDLHWGESWRRPDEVEWRRVLGEVVARDAWIIDGNYLPCLSLRLARAEMIIVIGAPASLCLLRIIKRAIVIALGSTGDLPAAVRAEAEAGRRVTPTRDFRALLGKVTGFNRRDAVTMIGLIEAGPPKPTVMIYHGGAWGRRAVARHLPARASTRLHWRTAKDAMSVVDSLTCFGNGESPCEPPAPELREARP